MTKVKEATIRLESSDQALITDLFSSSKVTSGHEIEIEKGISLRYERLTIREAVDFPPIIEITLVLAKDVVLPIGLGVFSNWLYDKIKHRHVKKFRIGDFEVEIDKDKIQEMLLKEIKEKLIRETHIVKISLPEIRQHDLLRSARTLSQRPITFDGKELPYPDNEVYFADLVSGKVETTLHVRDEELNGAFRRKVRLYAKVETAPTPIYKNVIFIHLILSSKKLPSGHQVETIAS